MIDVALLVDERQLARLKNDLAFISDRLTALDALIASLRLPPSSYRQQELQSERSTWAAPARVIAAKIEELTRPDAERVRDAERTEKLRQSIINRYRKECIARAEDFARQGD